MKRFAPATERNSTPILEVLREVLPRQGTVLEIASGTGQHAVFFAPIFPHLRWHPTDVDEVAMASIRSWVDDAGTTNIAEPEVLDVTTRPWPLDAADAIICCNMIHIAPWEACVGLLEGAGRILPPGGVLYLYGPFFESGVETAPSNLEFDRSLQGRDPSWGIRQLSDVLRVATDNGLRFDRKVVMPANNLSVVFRKR